MSKTKTPEVVIVKATTYRDGSAPRVGVDFGDVEYVISVASAAELGARLSGVARELMRLEEKS